MATAAVFGYMAIGISAAIVVMLMVMESSVSRKRKSPTSSDWIIVGEEKGSLIGEFIECTEDAR